MEDPTSNGAARKYAAAQVTHYTDKDLRKAFVSYNDIIVSHPDSPEAGYSRTQILNMATRILNEDELLESQMRLALAKLDSTIIDDRIADLASAEDDRG